MFLTMDILIICFTGGGSDTTDGGRTCGPLQPWKPRRVHHAGACPCKNTNSCTHTHSHRVPRAFESHDSSKCPLGSLPLQNRAIHQHLFIFAWFLWEPNWHAKAILFPKILLRRIILTFQFVGNKLWLGNKIHKCCNDWNSTEKGTQIRLARIFQFGRFSVLDSHNCQLFQ